MTLTFALGVIYWWGPTSLLSEGPRSKHSQVIKLFSTKAHGDLDHDFCPQCHLLVRTNIPSKFEGPSPKHCQVIKLFSTKSPGDLDLCPQDHLLVRTNISTKLEGPNHKHCRSVSFFGTKGHGDLEFWLKRSSALQVHPPISLIVLGLIIANGFLHYVKKVTPPPPPPMGGASFNPRGIIWTALSNAWYQISKA